ncbi:MAG: metallophosphoesterase [Archangium sp.]|nr:metallophosphoesterase [Archangium sp.]
MRLAHFSDIHVTHFPLEAKWALKRLAAVASYTFARRGAHFAGSDQRIASLLADVDGQQIDHALCTGDLTGVAAEAEFTRVAQLFGPRLAQPERFTVIAGNHDRYVTGEPGYFEQHFGALSERGQYPFVKTLPGGVKVVGVDSARPTSLTDSSGLVGAAQREKLLGILTDPSLRDAFVVVALHYGLLRRDGTRDTPAHGLRDDVELTSLLDRPDVTVDLVLHGHLHRSFRLRTQRRTVVNAGSATDLHSPGCGYNVYDIDPTTFRVTAARRVWSVAEDRYLPALDAPLAGTFVTR